MDDSEKIMDIPGTAHDKLMQLSEFEFGEDHVLGKELILEVVIFDSSWLNSDLQ